MSGMDSLEDMLAALEGGDSSFGRPRESSVIPEYEAANTIDDFLEALEAESHSYPKMAPKRQSVSVAPQASVPAQSFQDLYTSPREMEQDFSAADEAQAHTEVANANWFDPATSPEYRNPQEAANAFQEQGYSIHTNKGKWINYQGGDATDFRIKGTTSTKVGYIHAITLKALDDYGNPAKINGPRDFIGCILTHKQSGDEIQCWYRDNNDATYDLGFFAARPGTVRVEIKLCGNPMFDIDVQVEAAGRSLWVAKPHLPVQPGAKLHIDIATEDGSRPEGVAPFEVQTMGDVEDLKLMNNGDGTYKFTCLPQGSGFVTIQITLHGQPIKGSPVTVQVGEKQGHYVKQVSKGVQEKEVQAPPSSAYASAYAASTPAPSSSNVTRVVAQAVPLNAQPANARPSYSQPDPAYSSSNPAPVSSGDFYGDTYIPEEAYQPRESSAEVTTDDLNALLDELGA